MKLKELLIEDGYDSCSDTRIMVHSQYGDMAVSHRYLAGGWNDVLNKEAERIQKGEYITV